MNPDVNYWLLQGIEAREKIKELEERLNPTTSKLTEQEIFARQLGKEVVVQKDWQEYLVNIPPQ